MITVISIFFVIVSSLIGYIFFAPFYLDVDSRTALYRIRFHRLTSVSFQITDDSWYIQLKILGWSKQLDLFAAKPEIGATQSRQTKKIEKAKTKRRSISFKKIIGVLKSFRINHCQIFIDLGDVRANALLFPIIYWVKIKSNENIQVNFIGKNEIVLEVENSLARMSWAYISS
jgi:hypothetical protein